MTDIIGQGDNWIHALLRIETPEVKRLPLPGGLYLYAKGQRGNVFDCHAMQCYAERSVGSPYCFFRFVGVSGQYQRPHDGKVYVHLYDKDGQYVIHSFRLPVDSRFSSGTNHDSKEGIDIAQFNAAHSVRIDLVHSYVGLNGDSKFTP